jgi:hypothetical protein
MFAGQRRHPPFERQVADESIYQAALSVFHG